MTSEQVMLSLAAAVLLLGGCLDPHARDAEAPLELPGAQRQVWAVAPLLNEAGTREADGVAVADHLARQLENVRGLNVVPVNRVLAAMEQLQMPLIDSPQAAAKLRQVLGVDGLVVGTISDYDPYDPPKLGLSVELYVDPLDTPAEGLDPRQLSRAATDELTRPANVPATGPRSAVSTFYDASAPTVRRQLKRYAQHRDDPQWGDGGWRLYRISMDLYTEFVSYQVSSRLMEAERRRLQPATQPATPSATEPTAESTS